VFSAINSLTLSSALAAILLKPPGARRDPLAWLLDTVLGWFFRLFNWSFRIGTGAYARFVGLLLRGSVVVLAVYGGLLALTTWVFTLYPIGFIPRQDQGWLLVNVQLPDSASVQRTQQVLQQIDRIARGTQGVAHTAAVAGFSILMSTNSSNFGSMFIILDPFEDRRASQLSANAIMVTLREEFRQIKGATFGVFGAPPVPGIGIADGFKLMVEDRGALGLDSLQHYTDLLAEKGRQQRHLIVVPTIFRSSTPQLYMDIDRVKAESLGVSMSDINDTLQMYLGSLYVNNFTAFRTVVAGHHPGRRQIP